MGSAPLHYLTIAREGDPNADTVEGLLWIGSLALTNAAVPIYAIEHPLDLHVERVDRECRSRDDDHRGLQLIVECQAHFPAAVVSRDSSPSGVDSRTPVRDGDVEPLCGRSCSGGGFRSNPRPPRRRPANAFSSHGLGQGTDDDDTRRRLRARPADG
jgi:hypothetical protein